MEYFCFTYFNWLVVVPSFVPFMLFWVGVSKEQLISWIIMSVFTSLYIGWITVKADSKFAPWFYKKMRMNIKTDEQIKIFKVKAHCWGKENVSATEIMRLLQ